MNVSVSVSVCQSVSQVSVPLTHMSMCCSRSVSLRLRSNPFGQLHCNLKLVVSHGFNWSVPCDSNCTVLDCGLLDTACWNIKCLPLPAHYKTLKQIVSLYTITEYQTNSLTNIWFLKLSHWNQRSFSLRHQCFISPTFDHLIHPNAECCRIELDCSKSVALT